MRFEMLPITRWVNNMPLVRSRRTDTGHISESSPSKDIRNGSGSVMNIVRSGAGQVAAGLHLKT